MNNFYKRTNEACDKNKSNDFIGFIDNVINLFPNLKIKENSLLYKAAINQYNTESIKLPTIDRISIPSWFCGYIDPNTGLLYTSNEEIIQTNSLLLQQNLAANILSGIPNSAYPIDKCLSATASQPGNLSYSNCEVIVLSDVYLSAIEWSTAFYPTSTIEEGIQQIEQTVADNMNAFAASYGVSNVHKNLTEEECNGLVGLYGGSCKLKNDGKYEFDLKDGTTDNQEECLARYYRQEVAQGEKPQYHNPGECNTLIDIGGTGCEPAQGYKSISTKKGELKSASIGSDNHVAMNSSGITSENGYKLDGEIRAMLRINGRKVDWLKESQVNRSTRKTLGNLFGQEYYQPIKKGDKVTVSIASIDQKVETKSITVTWGGEDTYSGEKCKSKFEGSP